MFDAGKEMREIETLAKTRLESPMSFDANLKLHKKIDSYDQDQMNQLGSFADKHRGDYERAGLPDYILTTDDSGNLIGFEFYSDCHKSGHTSFLTVKNHKLANTGKDK